MKKGGLSAPFLSFTKNPNMVRQYLIARMAELQSNIDRHLKTSAEEVFSSPAAVNARRNLLVLRIQFLELMRIQAVLETENVKHT